MQTSIEDLPRLSDQERDALDIGYLAVAGVPSTRPQTVAEVIAAERARVLSEFTGCLKQLDHRGIEHVLRAARGAAALQIVSPMI